MPQMTVADLRNWLAELDEAYGNTYDDAVVAFETDDHKAEVLDNTVADPALTLLHYNGTVSYDGEWDKQGSKDKHVLLFCPE